MVIVDTSVWLQFLRSNDLTVRAEMDLLRAKGEIHVVGVVVAEILQGARSRQELEQLEDRLAAFPYLPDTAETWTRVGNLSFQLRLLGNPVPMVDVLIAALAIENGCSVYTLDQHFQRIPGVALHQLGP